MTTETAQCLLGKSGKRIRRFILPNSLKSRLTRLKMCFCGKQTCLLGGDWQKIFETPSCALKRLGVHKNFFFGGGGQLFSDEHSSVDSIKKIRLYDNFRTLTHLKRKLLLLLGAKINGSAPDIVYKCPCDAKKAQKIGKSQGAIRSFKIN